MPPVPRTSPPPTRPRSANLRFPRAMSCSRNFARSSGRSTTSKANSKRICTSEYGIQHAGHAFTQIFCRHLKIQAADEIDSWKERLLAAISEANEDYRSSTLQQLHSLAERARACGAPRELFGAVRRIVRCNGDIYSEVEKVCSDLQPRVAVLTCSTQLITFYDKVAPGLSDIQRTYMGSEIQWMRSGFVMIQEVQDVVQKELQRSTFHLQVLACPHVSPAPLV